ncbi:hypothetical protein PVK06_006754 [Gossypium arboreum]|uniref:RNase H type-1 domain-containing protein n=1 Tax=Gossypium arboreum TaxID=29729 RepID=A0ABR0QGH0_GOSAR|nr:hypothetical protein PVK06_006754 [Gossypium arboreum]
MDDDCWDSQDASAHHARLWKLSRGVRTMEFQSAVPRSLRKMVLRGWEVKVQHSCREGNRLADAMAALAMGRPVGMQVYSTPQVGVHLLLADTQ